MRKSRTVTVLLIMGMLICAALGLISAAKEHHEAEAMTVRLQTETEIAQRENETLRAKLENADSESAVKEFAEEFFGFSDPDKIVFTDTYKNKT